MGRQRRRTVLVALAAAGLIGLAGGVATAHKKTIDTRVQMSRSASAQGDSFIGTLSAGGGCQRGREVTVSRADPGAQSQVIGIATTDASGAFRVQAEGSASPGDYIAVAATDKVKKGDRHRHKCLEGTSNVVTVGDGPPPSPPPPPPPYNPPPYP
jgi:hypothetical protein